MSTYVLLLGLLRGRVGAALIFDPQPGTQQELPKYVLRTQAKSPEVRKALLHHPPVIPGGLKAILL